MREKNCGDLSIQVCDDPDGVVSVAPAWLAWIDRVGRPDVSGACTKGFLVLLPRLPTDGAAVAARMGQNDLLDARQIDGLLNAGGDPDLSWRE